MYRFEAERQKHIEEYGSFLYCPEHDTLCCYMEDAWTTGEGCRRRLCLCEDPEYQKLQERIRKNVARRKAAKEEPQRNIRRQKKTRRESQLEKIQRLEEESRKAYKRNRPKVGEDKLQQAIILRAQLRKEEE